MFFKGKIYRAPVFMVKTMVIPVDFPTNRHFNLGLLSAGETDMRGCYCAIATASMLHILTDELLEGVPEYISRCQTWEGGIAGEEGLEVDLLGWQHGLACGPNLGMRKDDGDMFHDVSSFRECGLDQT